jgi:hypothetical protein
MNSEELEAKVGKDDIVYRLIKRAEIRRQIPDRKSVQEGQPDRIADLLEEAASVIDALRGKTFISVLEDLNSVVKAFHGRAGTFNFHFSKFELLPWDIDLDGLTREQWEALDVEDWVVRIVWVDNSFSHDTYYVPLKEILAWHEENKSKKTGV